MRLAPLLAAVVLLPACTDTSRNATPAPTQPGPAASASATPSGRTQEAPPGTPPTTTPPAAARPVPRGFSPRSASFVSESRGWVLGATGKSAAVVETRDGGRTWSLSATFPVGLGEVAEARHVRQVRFLNERVGWLYGNETYVTRDGGATWRTVTMPGGRELRAIAAVGDQVYALLGRRTTDGFYDAAVWKGTVGSDTFTRADAVDTDTLADEIAVSGRTVLFGSGVTARVSNDGGRTWANRTPCPKDMGVENIAAVSERDVFFACVALYEHQFERSVRLSRDGGRTTVNRLHETNAWSGARIAGSSPTRLVRALDPQGSEDDDTRSLQWSSDGGRTFHRTGPSVPDRETMDWQDLRFHTATFVTAARHRWVESETYYALYASRDGGRTWVRLPLGQ